MSEIIELRPEGVYVALQRHCPTNYAGISPTDVLALDASIKPEESTAIADKLRPQFATPPSVSLCSPVRRAVETVRALWGEEHAALHTILDGRLGFWPDPNEWRAAFDGVEIGTPREQFKHAPDLIAQAADQAIMAIYEQVRVAKEGSLVGAITHSPTADLIAARFLQAMLGKSEPQWLRPFAAGDIALIHLVGPKRTVRNLQFIKA